jgi:uncharacterized membrane protein YfcA
MTPGDALIIFATGIVAGAINAVAGGGTLLTFPILLWLGRDPIIANATNALSLSPGSLAGAYALRKEAFAARAILRWLLPIGVVGSLIGGVLLLATPTRVFSGIVPGLVLGATLLLAVQRPLKARLQMTAGDGTAAHAAEHSSPRRAFVLAFAQLLVSIYGGYFGAAAGILMLAAYGLFGVADIHQRNGIKNVLATVNNGVASIYFIAKGAVDWHDALVLGVSAIIGGYLGGALSRRLSQRAVELIVIAIGVAATLVLAIRHWSSSS